MLVELLAGQALALQTPIDYTNIPLFVIKNKHALQTGGRQFCYNCRMSQERLRAKGAQALFAAAFSYALTGVLVREVSSMWSDSGQVAARFILVVFLLAGYRLFRRDKWVITKTKAYLCVGLGLLFGLMVLLFTIAIEKTTVANVLFVFYATNMISSFGLGTIVLKENISRSKIAALVLAVLGLALYSGAIVDDNKGIIFAVFAGLFGGTTSLINKQLTGVDRNLVLLMQYAVGTVFVLATVLFSGEAILRTASIHASLLTIFFALIITLGSYFTLYGFQNFDVNIGTVITSTELVSAAVMAYFFFHEVPKPHELLGGLLIFTGSVVGSGIFERTKTNIKTAPR
jgi:drug/metabolite transporter (DMT)-like permease